MKNPNQCKTGPKSAAGKRIASMNALKSGLYAKTPVLPFEDDQQYRRHVKSVMRSLEPEDAVQLYIAQQIADCMWRGTRLEYRSALQRDKIFEGLTPGIMAELMGFKGLLAKYPASILITPNEKVSVKESKHFADIYQEFAHYENNAKGVSNYNMVWRQYPKLFAGMGKWMRDIKPPLFMANQQGLDIYWQNHPRKLEPYINEFGTLAWYYANFKDLRAQIRNWMSIWFFLQNRHGESIERFDDRVALERRQCIQLLDNYFRLRKSKDEHALMTHRYLQITPPNTFENIVLPHEIPKVVIGKNEMPNLVDESSTS
jgi:hypothetical protein